VADGKVELIRWKVTREVDATLYVMVQGEAGHDATVEDLRAALDALPEADRPGLCEECQYRYTSLDLLNLRSAVQGLFDALDHEVGPSWREETFVANDDVDSVNAAWLILKAALDACAADDSDCEEDP